MNKEILKNILILDSIYRVLDWKDRVRIHLLMQGRIEAPSLAIQRLLIWVFETRWKPPIKLDYGQDRLMYVELNDGSKILVEDYRKHVKIDLPKLV